MGTYEDYKNICAESLCGANSYYKLFGNVIITDSVQKIADTLDCYWWLNDIVADVSQLFADYIRNNEILWMAKMVVNNKRHTMQETLNGVDKYGDDRPVARHKWARTDIATERGTDKTNYQLCVFLEIENNVPRFIICTPYER